MGIVSYVPLGIPYLETVATAWLYEASARGNYLNDGHIIVPTQRTARALSAAFLRASGREALVLPTITAIGNLDEPTVAFHSGLTLLPAMQDSRRHALMAQMIDAMKDVDGKRLPISTTWSLAKDLAALMDEATRAGVDLSRANEAIPAELARHWERTAQFVQIAADAMPRLLKFHKEMSPEERRVALMDNQSAAWAENPPETPVWLLGAAYASKALAEFARRVAHLPTGNVCLAGFDPLFAEAAIDPEDTHIVHPAVGPARLLAHMGIRPDEVTPLTAPTMVSVPAGIAAFKVNGERLGEGPVDASHVSVIDAPDEHIEDQAIALAIRAALEKPDGTVAFVTPSREQAMRVAQRLGQIGIRAEDSAGDPVLDTPPGRFLRAIADAMASDFQAVDILGVLKMPFAAIGGDRDTTLYNARRLEETVVRKLHPAAGFDALIASTKEATGKQPDDSLMAFADLVSKVFSPIAQMPSDKPVPFNALLDALVRTMAELSPAEASGIWTGEAGAALANAITVLGSDVGDLIQVSPRELAPFLVQALDGVSVRRPRAKDINPRVAIFGLLEAQLIDVDTVIVGGLTEGTFPASPNPGPWFSRNMREAIGLDSMENKLSQQAHQFMSLLHAGKEVILSVPRRSGGAPAVPSRFVLKLEAATGGIARHPAPQWAAAVDRPTERVIRPAPRPLPPTDYRPRIFTVSDIATLMSDPYSFYARRILKIKPLDGLEERDKPSLFGDIVHNGYAKFLQIPEAIRRPDAPSLLFSCFLDAFPDGRPQEGTGVWWRSRLQRLAEWCVTIERTRAFEGLIPVTRGVEVPGRWQLPGTDIVIVGRADRLERMPDDTIQIMDYKTGTVPTQMAVSTGVAPQLLIEAAMAKAGAFGPEYVGKVSSLSYWSLTGGSYTGKIIELYGKNGDALEEAVTTAGEKVTELLAYFLNPNVPFLATPHPSRVNRYDPYAGISRRAVITTGVDF